MLKSAISSAVARLSGALVVGLALVMGCGVAQANMVVTPVILNLPAQPGASAEMSVTNQTTDTAMPIEITLTRMAVDRDGKVTETPDDGTLLVFPPMATVAGKQTQVFRVQYVGAPLPAGQTYYIHVKQLPVARPEGTTGVQVLYNFKALVNVIPPGAEVSLAVVGTEVVKGEGGANNARILVRNTGASQAMMRDLQLRLVQEEGGRVVFDKTLSPTEVGNSVGVGLIPAGGERFFTIQEALPSAGGQVSAELKYVAR